MFTGGVHTSVFSYPDFLPKVSHCLKVYAAMLLYYRKYIG